MLAEEITAYSQHALLLGHVLWILAYGLILAKSSRDRLVGIPLVALFLNISWEALVFSNCYTMRGERGWCVPTAEREFALALAFVLALDIMLWFQALLITAARIKPLQALAVFVLAPLAAFWLHGYVIGAFHDRGGLVDSWIINLTMSALFVRLALVRARGEGLSFLAAVAKLLGSLAVVVGLWIEPATFSMHNERATAVYLLALGVLVLDVAYAVIVWRRQPPEDRVS